MRFELLRAGASPIQARSASKWIRRFGRLVSGPSRTHSLALRASARWRVAHTSTQRQQVDPAFRAPRFRSFTDPLACASSFCALARSPYKHAAPASGSRVSVCHRLSICDLSRLSVFRPCSVRVPSVFRPCSVRSCSSNHRGPNLRSSSRLGVFALSGSSASGCKLQQSSRHAPSCRPPRCAQPQPRRVVCTQKGKSLLSVPAATSCRWSRRQRETAKRPAESGGRLRLENRWRSHR